MSTKATAASPALGLSIDEELWFGTSDGEAAERAAAQSMAAVVGRIYGAKPFPEAARRLGELTRRESTPTQELVDVLEHDPALAAKLLRLVNSSAFGLRQRCTSIRHAVTLVGSKQLNQLATTAAVMDMFATDSQLALGLLEHCTVVGAFSRYLGLHLGLPVEDLFTAGTLHDIGKLMLLETFADEYRPLLEQNLTRADVLHSLERAKYGFDHGVLAAHVLKAWNIPDPIPKLVSWHHEPARAYAASSQLAGLVQTLRLADSLAVAVTAGATRAEAATIARQDSATYLGVSEAQLDALWPELEQLRARSTEHGSGAAEPSSAEGGSRARLRSARPAPSAPVPQRFPCVECGTPSFGATCPACKGYTCPAHPPDSMSGWCGLCTTEYARFAKENAFIDAKKGVLATSGILLLSMLAFASTGGAAGLVRGFFLGVVLALGLGGLVLIGQRSYARARFLRTRPPRAAPPATT
jgi:putative nucleotidyltransferase with HDIG domain